MPEIKMTLNVLLSLMIDSKIKGSGKIGNGRLLVKLLQVIADNKGEERTHERNLIACFNDDVNKADSYSKINKLIDRFLPNGGFYPYEKLTFTGLEKCMGNAEKTAVYLRKMQSVCDEIIDREKLDSLVYTLLNIIRLDDSIGRIFYGSEFVPKEKLFGSYAHPKRICVEALLLGLLYHVHKNPADTSKTELLEIPARRTFRAVRFNDENSLNLELPIGLMENIRDGTRHQESADIKYTLELRHENELIKELPDSENIFLYGVGGSGKSTLLLNRIRNENTVNFYLPLYQYRQEIHEKIRSGSCWILLNILLKYHYQYEYRTYEACGVCEGEDILLRQLAIIDRELKADPNNIRPKYVLLLDGMNEIPSGLHEIFVSELTWIISEWKNVRIIISGRIIPQYDVFSEFKHIELCGIQDFELINTLSKIESEYSPTNDKDLLEILKIPVFLNIYLESHTSENKLNKRGEVIDSYIMNWKDNSPDGGATKFIVQFVFPLVCKDDEDSFIATPLLRASLLEYVDTAIELYLSDERIYQNIAATRKINREAVLEIRKKDDFIDMIINNISFVEEDSETHSLSFTHNFYTDYFAAKHVMNALEVIKEIKKPVCSIDEVDEFLSKYMISGIWFGETLYYSTLFAPYKRLGEICGDYRNAACENFEYHRTILDYYLDVIRDANIAGVMENMIKVMSISRNNVICGVDFRKMGAPLLMPTYAQFSLNGEYPCNFSESTIYKISLFHFESNYSYAIFGDLMLILFNYYGNAALWNIKENKPVRSYNLFEDIFDVEGFSYVEMSPDGKYADALSLVEMLRFEIETGKLIKSFEFRDPEFKDVRNRYRQKKDTIKPLDKELLTKIVSCMNIFKGCDFSGATFLDKYEKEMLSKTGAICDLTEDKFIEGRQKENASDWIEISEMTGSIY